MHADGASVDALLVRWRQAGQDAMDPAALARIAALHARLPRYSGPVRERLQARLQALVDAYAQRLQHWQPASPAPVPDAAGALAALVAMLEPRRQGQPAPVAGTGPEAGERIPPAPALPALESLDESRRTWTRLRTQSQLRHSLEQLPEDAGPLNSAVLAHRALSLMLELGNGYLEHFVTYVDTLASLEQLRALVPLRAGDATLAARPGKAPRKPRKRKADPA